MTQNVNRITVHIDMPCRGAGHILCTGKIIYLSFIPGYYKLRYSNVQSKQ